MDSVKPEVKPIEVKPNDLNQMDDEKNHTESNKITETGFEPDDVIVKEADSSEKDEVPEIVNIYDYIYGNVQNKLEFYEEKCSESRRASVVDYDGLLRRASIVDYDGLLSRSRKASVDSEGNETRLRKTSVDNDGNFSRRRTTSVGDRSLSRTTSVDNERKRPISRRISLNNGIRRSLTDGSISSDSAFISAADPSPTRSIDSQSNLFNDCTLLEQEEINGAVDVTNNNESITNGQCVECQKHTNADDRTEILTEINSQLKVELENVNENLKQESLRSTELSSKITYIESILETYYKETKNNKTHFGTLYTAMKDYVVDQKFDYTYKKIKCLANYIENLKNKLDNQDKIIKNNFLENPYSQDLMVKHAFLRKQLDEMCKENEYLKEELRIKTSESIDMMKELNRQKFEVENRYSELEKLRESEITANEDITRKVRLRHEQQVQELQILLESKDQDKLEVKRKYEAMISNYQTENSILYRKLRQQNKV